MKLVEIVQGGAYATTAKVYVPALLGSMVLNVNIR